ncbi:hypothetical protein GQ43DRAFT_209497 [Delitschia confertaspora ATCC 74209]|uniref:Zn(2)-C6 fungal-type domain-containing protein n=1 Tax=Delitschia confertaspora ATCC 74209 TaxID=1513339 RepID=A0A9P4JIZ9_9PLEO|nr:hypothetical protein GQ43DRAFT_209497 [Delitschia confertaspora ATCC 74209]
MDSASPKTLDQSTGASQVVKWETPPVEDSPAGAAEETSPTNENDPDNAQKPSAIPMQKRRRVTRACDECRRKKIKCDGKQPCTHCTVYSYECTYDQPSNRRRNAAPQYIEALETQLKRAKALLHIVFPNLDLSDPSIDSHLQNGILPQVAVGHPHARPHYNPTEPPRLPMPSRRDQQPNEQNDSNLESMVRATGQLELDEEGHWDYHGHSSGFSFMKRMREQFGDFIAPASGAFVKYRPMSQILDSPKSAVDSPAESNMALSSIDLPSRELAKQLCEHALVEAGTLVRSVHIPSFYKSVDRMYDTPPGHYGHAENTFLPLLYAVLAVGTLFSRSNMESDKAGYETAIEEGFKYFRASRQMLDIGDCRDLTSLQAILYMIQFLQSSAKLSTCYAYIGVAQRSALRMGLHRSFSMNFNPIEAETRKRVFWVIRRMDIYVGAMLGLPHFLSDEDIDQELPTEVDDEYITETEILPMPEGKISVMAGCNAHTRIVNLLAKICKYIYPIKGTQSGGTNSVTYSVSYSKIRELEQDLQTWLDELPMALKPGGEAPMIIIRVQQLLRMAFGHAQLLLYRPFLHYVSQSYKSKTADQRPYACASACVSVSRNIIHITTEMRKRGLLTGAYWYSMYTTFFAIISIIYYVLENPENPTSAQLLRDALEGKDALAQFAKFSMAADRCAATLTNIFDKLPEHIKRGADPAATRKRRQGGSPQSLVVRPTYNPDPDSLDSGPRRASTFPDNVPTTKRASFPHGMPISQPHLAPLGRESPYQSSGMQRNSEFFDPTPGLTSTSASPSTMGFNVPQNQTPIQGPSQSIPTSPLTTNFLDPTALNVPVSDVSAMMFPSADPFAYPNQPMTTFENTNNLQSFHQKVDSVNAPSTYHGYTTVPSPMDIKPRNSMFNPSNVHSPNLRRTNTGMSSEADVQLFNPLPMYLMQGGNLAAATHNQQQFQAQQQHQGFPNAQAAGGGGGGHVNFDDLFSGEEWANTFMDQGIGFGPGGQGFGRGAGTGGAMGMGDGWR